MHDDVFTLQRLTSKELVEALQYYKEENKILRSKLPRVVQVTKQERSRLLNLSRLRRGLTAFATDVA